jgi:hypothetical protein
MQIWMSNSRGNVVYQHCFFALIRDNLLKRRGPWITERFQSLKSLADLPWLDQPRLLDPSTLTMELRAAWDELWTLKLSELSVPANFRSASDLESSRNLTTDSTRDHRFGRYLAAPLHDLAVFAASTSRTGVLRAATHRCLIVGPERRLRDWRILQGGLSRSPRSSRSKNSS